jgi:hypothetical protein
VFGATAPAGASSGVAAASNGSPNGGSGAATASGSPAGPSPSTVISAPSGTAGGPSSASTGSPAGSAAASASGVASAPTILPGPNVTVTVVAAGDIACDPSANVGAPANCDQAATAALIGALHPNAVLPLGDLQYEKGALAGFQTIYGPTWGKYLSITYPAVGNHEYLTNGAAGYFTYFKQIPAYYSYSLGDWHLISLDSECSFVGGCGAGSAQERWLRADLAAHPNVCTLAYWHEPRWSSGEWGDATQMTAIWNDLVAAHAAVVLAGHNHDYERFVPLDGGGVPDPAGVTEFVVGTGGKNHTAFPMGTLSGEVVRNSTAYGVLRLALGPAGFSWRFYSVSGSSFTDSGSAACP